MATNRAIVLFLTAAFLAATACSSKSTPDPEVQADDVNVAVDTPVETRRVEPAPDMVDRVAPVDLVEEVDETSEIDAWEYWCEQFKPECEVGEAKCMYANTQAKYCMLADDGCSKYWSEPEPCPENSTCQTPGGCVCNYGVCTPHDDPEQVCSGKQLTGCNHWYCDDGCCAATDHDCIPPDCTDCISPETGEKLQPCPAEIPDGFVENKCTIDAFMNGECQWIATDSMCDDGDLCTEDACDPATGACVHPPVPDPPFECWPGFCWGETAEDASKKCEDQNACTAQKCDYGEDGFVPWVGQDPENPDPDNLEAGIGMCTFKDFGEGCEDDDPCTINGCDPLTGCTSEPDLDNPDCACETAEDCNDGNPCTVGYCEFEFGICAYLPLDCNDDCPCTKDLCEPGSPEGEDPCLHVEDPWLACDYADPWSDLIHCMTAEDCSGDCGTLEDFFYSTDCCVSVECVFDDPANGFGQCVFSEKLCFEAGICGEGWCDQETCECMYVYLDCDDDDPCTLDGCDPDDLATPCYSTPLVCDDGDPCTTDSCNPDTPEGDDPCLHEVVPDC